MTDEIQTTQPGEVPRDPVSGGIVPDTTLPVHNASTGKTYFDHDRGPNAEAGRAEVEALWPEMAATELLDESEVTDEAE